MKKFLVIFAAALLMMGLAGQANATFTVGDLIRVVYETGVNGGTYEVATDLGKATNIMNGTAQLNANTLSLFGTGTQFTNTTDPTTLMVAYVAVTGIGGALWTSGTYQGTEDNAPAATTKVTTAAYNLYGLYSSATATTTNGAWIPFSNNHSYYWTMDGKNDVTAGAFDSFYNTNSDGELRLAVGSQDMDIYYWAKPGTYSTQSGAFTLVTTVDANGNITTSELSGAAPIPPSVLLFGSGLLGLIGIRRRDIFSL